MHRFVAWPRESIAEWVIYKISPEGERSILTRHVVGSHDLNMCQGDDPYPDLDSRLGYIHAFGLTDNYIIIPESSWLADPCSMLLGFSNPTQPFYRGNQQWYGDTNSRVIIIRKSDGVHVRTLQMDSGFITHFSNSFEEDNKIHMDVFLYNDMDIYKESFRAESMIKNEFEKSIFTRMTIDLDDMTLSKTGLRRGGQPDVNDFASINRKYHLSPYTFTYFIQNPYLLNGGIVKLNVRTGEELRFTFPSTTLPYEPIFIPKPDSVEEDDGNVLVQATDLANDKTLLYILDARTMTLVAQVVAPDISLPGLHNNFYPCNVGGEGSGDTSACKTYIYNSSNKMYLSYISILLILIASML